MKFPKTRPSVPAVTTEGDQMLKVRDVSVLLRIHRSTIYRKIKDGSFPSPQYVFNRPRWRRRELATWIDAQPRTSQEHAGSAMKPSSVMKMNRQISINTDDEGADR